MELAQIDQIIDAHREEASELIQVMLEIQSDLHWLPRAALDRISDRLDVPLAKILHIATFYKAFSLVPKGRHQVHVCMGTACHVRGAPRVLDAIAGALGIGAGESDAELKFSLETVNCLGCCALGPVVEIDGKPNGNVSVAKAPSLLKDYD